MSEKKISVVITARVPKLEPKPIDPVLLAQIMLVGRVFELAYSKMAQTIVQAHLAVEAARWMLNVVR